jgi:molybdopterin-guanine dinucleotide biosynthesis protein A
MYTLQGKTRSTCYTFSTLDSRMVLNHTSPMVRVGNLSSVPTGMKHARTPKKVLATKDRLSQPSSWVASFFLPCDSPGVGRRGFGPVVTQLHQLTEVITPACDRYVQYLLTGANPSVLSRHIRGLQPSRCRLSTYYSPTFPIDGLHFPPKGPVRSSV